MFGASPLTAHAGATFFFFDLHTQHSTMPIAIAQHTTSGMTMITTRIPTPRPTAAAQNYAH